MLPDYDLNHSARRFIQQDQVKLGDDLHLGVTMRSFRAETLSGFISHLLNGEAEAARTAFAQLTAYPIVITRGTERFGLVASSGAYRLKPEGRYVTASIEPANWFLNDRKDVRSSWYLEDVAIAFDVQGLELNWVGVCWDADYRYSGDGWQHHKFARTKRRHVNDGFAQLYLKNAYRVILTRARQGMVNFVPKGGADDPTRPPEFYDATWRFLTDCGLPPLAVSG